jgi:hypothetical protein
MNTCLKHQQSYYIFCPYCGAPSVGVTTTSTPMQTTTVTTTPTGYSINVVNKWFRIDHIRRHIKSIQIELEKVFPSKKIIQRETLQILIRLTDQVEELMKGQNK